MTSYPFAINLMGELPYEEELSLIKKTGYEGIFFGWDSDIWANYRLVSAAKERGLQTTSFHAPFGKCRTIWKEGERGDLATTELITCLRHCALLKVPVMVAHVYVGFDKPLVSEIGLERFGKVIAEAEKLGVVIGFENTEGEPCLEAIFKRYGNSPSVGFCLDTGHEVVYNNRMDLLAKYGKKLVHTHFNDNQGPLPIDNINHTYYYDLHQVMGDGVVDWKNVMDRIEKVGYSGFISCELTHHGTDYYPGTHDKYRAMSMEEFYAYTFERVNAVVKRQI